MAKTHMKLTPKGFQNGGEIDAKTHQQSMPKLLTEKIMKVIKNQVCLNGKIIEIHCKNKGCFKGLAGCMCERETHQLTVKSETRIHPTTYEKSIQISCSEKGYPKYWNSLRT